MRGAVPLARVRGKHEAGFTLVELLIAGVLGLVVVGAAVTVFTASIRSEPGISSRAAQIQQARTTMERLTRELRQGSGVATASPSQLSMNTYVNSATCGGDPSAMAIECRVTYSCSADDCTRTEAQPADGSAPGPAVLAISGLSSSDVFSYSPDATDPSYVAIRLEYPAETGDDAITLTDGVALRNRSGP